MAQEVAEGVAPSAGVEEIGALRLHDAAERHGAFSWAERRLFELTGAWAAAPGPADDARVLLFEASAQHAWHAELWADRLPVLAGVDREGLVRPCGDTLAAVLESLEPPRTSDTAAAGAAAGFLAGLARVVLPGLLGAYRDYAGRLVPVADGPAARALSLVVRDEREELAAVAALAGAADIAVGGGVDAAVGRLEALLGGRDPAAAFFTWSKG